MQILGAFRWKTVCSTVLQQLFETYVLAKCTVRHYLAPKQLPDYTILRAIAFSEDPVVPSVDFMDVTGAFENQRWRECVQSCCDKFGWTKWKLEIRFVVNNRKSRVIVRDDDDPDGFAWPPHATECQTCRHPTMVSPDNMLISAKLHTLKGDGCIDVTRKLHKYEGLQRDFYKRRFYCHDLFPYDDNEHNAERFGKLEVIRLRLAKGLVKEVYDFSKNDLIANGSNQAKEEKNITVCQNTLA
jgi:hypothetical protein